MGAKVKEVEHDGTHEGWMLNCPGCATLQHTTGMHFYDKRWPLQGTPESPTFRPSYLSKMEYGDKRTPQVCHSFVTNGKIEFCGDCTHPLAGKTVDVPDWKDDD